MSKSEGTSYSLAEVEERGFSPLDLRYFFLQAHYRSKQNFT
jgi:cysteinyl-tRNA synthetase